MIDDFYLGEGVDKRANMFTSRVAEEVAGSLPPPFASPSPAMAGQGRAVRKCRHQGEAGGHCFHLYISFIIILLDVLSCMGTS